jgi:hypothetical protein
MFVTGLTHPSFSRSFGSSITEWEEIDGEFVLGTRPDPTYVFRALKAAININIAAMRLFHQACAAPSPPGDDD